MLVSSLLPSGVKGVDYLMAINGLGVPQQEAGYAMSCQTFPVGPGLQITLGKFDEVSDKLKVEEMQHQL